MKSKCEEMKVEVLTSELVKIRLKSCEKVSLEIIEELVKLEEEIRRHNTRVLTAKTSGTTVTALGTGLAVTGLIMAPFTLGTSLIVSSVGAVTSVTGAAANLVTDLINRSKTNKFLGNIHSLSTEEQPEVKADLLSLLQSLNEVMEPLMEKGLTETQALYSALKGDRASETTPSDTKDSFCKEEEGDFEWVETPDGKWKPIRKFCFKAGLNSLKLVKNSRTLTTLAGGGVQALSGGAGAGAVIGTRVATGSGGIFARVGHFLGSAAFKGTMAAVGVVFTSIDIALLVKEWKSTNPTTETIQIVINEFRQELDEYAKLEGKLDEVEACKMFLGWIGEIPVVGTSPLAVEGLLSLCGGDFKRVKGLYGDIPQLTSDTTDLKLAVLSHLYSQELIVGPLTFEHVRANISKLWDKESDGHNETDDPSANPIHPADPVYDLNKDLFEKMVSLDDSSSIGIPVFNPAILKLKEEIIDKFLEEGSHPSFQELKGHLVGTAVLEDYFQPLPSNVKQLMEKVLVSYHKSGGYFNGNKWEYELTVDLLKEHAIACLREEVAKANCKIKIDEEDEEGQSSSIWTGLDDLVEVLVNHRSFVDPLAAGIWTEGNLERNLYESTVASVTKLFTDLRFKIPVWACEISSALQLFPSH